MTSKYSMTSNVRYDEKIIMTSNVCHIERLSAVSDCLATDNVGFALHRLNKCVLPN